MTANLTDLLPEAGALKLERLRARVAERRAAASIAADALDARRRALQDALRDLQHVRMRNAGTPEVETSGLSTTTTHYRPDPEAETKALDRVARAEAEFLARQRFYADQDRAFRPIADLVAAIETFLAGVDGVLVDAGSVDPDLRPGETPEQAVARIRARLVEIERERAAVQRAPVDAETAKARAKELVESLAARPNIEGLLRPNADDDFLPQLGARSLPVLLDAYSRLNPTPADARVGHVSLADATNVLGLIAWAAPGLILDAMFAEIDRRASGNGLSDEERAKRLAALDKEQLQAERAEEAVITLAAEHNVEIMRRPDASPLAVLGVEVVEVEPAELGVAA